MHLPKKWMRASVLCVLLLLLADAVQIRPKDPRSPEQRESVLPAMLVYEMPVLRSDQRYSAQYAQPTTALIGYAVWLPIGQPVQRYLLEISFDTSEIDMWDDGHLLSSASYDKQQSDTVWFGWRPVRMTVRSGAGAQPSEACPQCSGRLGLARGSSWWLHFPVITFSSDSLKLGAGWAEQTVRWRSDAVRLPCDDDNRRSLCTVRHGRLRVGSSAAWSDDDIDVHFSIHRPALRLPAPHYQQFIEQFRDRRPRAKMNLFGMDENRTVERHSSSFPTIQVHSRGESGKIFKLGMHERELLARPDAYHEHLHVVAATERNEMFLSAALLHSYVISMDAGARVLTVHAHRVRDHLDWWSLLLVLALVYLLVRWVVTENWLHIGARKDAFALAYEIAGLLLTLAVLIYTGVDGVLADEKLLYGLAGGSISLAAVFELGATIACKTTTHVDGELERLVLATRYNIVRSSSHKYVLASALWLAFAARSRNGVDSLISLAIVYYSVYVLLYYFIWSVQFLIISQTVQKQFAPRVPLSRGVMSNATAAAAADEVPLHTPSFVFICLYTMVVTPALLAAGIYLLYVYLLLPYMQRNLMEYYDISRVLAVMSLVVLVPIAGIVAYLYLRKQLKNILQQEFTFEKEASPPLEEALPTPLKNSALRYRGLRLGGGGGGGNL